MEMGKSAWKGDFHHAEGLEDECIVGKVPAREGTRHADRPRSRQGGTLPLRHRRGMQPHFQHDAAKMCEYSRIHFHFVNQVLKWAHEQ